MNTDPINNRIKCIWPVKNANNNGTHPCDSEDRLFIVKGRSIAPHVVPAEQPICEKHLPEAWSRPTVHSAEPLCPTPASHDKTLMTNESVEIQPTPHLAPTLLSRWTHNQVLEWMDSLGYKHIDER